MTEISISDFRADLAESLRRARKNPIRITYHGEAQVVVLDASTYEKMLNNLEELEDIEEFDEVMAENVSGIPWNQVKKDLGF